MVRNIDISLLNIDIRRTESIIQTEQSGSRGQLRGHRETSKGEEGQYHRKTVMDYPFETEKSQHNASPAAGEKCRCVVGVPCNCQSYSSGNGLRA